jgi:hypothetical protein
MLSLGQISLRVTIPHVLSPIECVSTFQVLPMHDTWNVLLFMPWLVQTGTVTKHAERHLIFNTKEGPVSINCADSSAAASPDDFPLRRLTADAHVATVLRDITVGPDLDPVSAWMDDIFTSGDDFDTLLGTLDALLTAAEASNLRFCPAKTFLFISEATIGGAVVSKTGVQPDPDNVRAILEWQTPRTARDILAFVNTAAVYRPFIKDFGLIARPLYNLTRGIERIGHGKGSLKKGLEATSITARWTEEHTRSFTTLKTALTTFR